LVGVQTPASQNPTSKTDYQRNDPPCEVFQRLLTPELVPDEIFRAAFATLAMNPHNQ
jgi:hypothetical protein